jgi:N-acetylglucosamine malate deacetylase 1
MASVLGIRHVLVLGAHPDDEMSCAGYLAKLRESGCRISHAYFSTCAVSTTAPGFPPEQLLMECEASRDIMGVAAQDRFNHDFPVRCFPQYRQEILESLVRLNRVLRPDLVLTGANTDIHQDHSEPLRDCRRLVVLSYAAMERLSMAAVVA